MKIKLRCIFLAVIFLTVFCGCSSENYSRHRIIVPDSTPTPKIIIEDSPTKSPSKADLKGEISFFYRNREEGMKLAGAFMKEYPNIKVTVNFNSTENLNEYDRYNHILLANLSSGNETPDVFAVENPLARKIIENRGTGDELTDPLPEVKGVCMDLTEEFKDKIDNMMPYSVEIGRDEAGRQWLIPLNVCPGGVAYKRDIAKKYLGTDDPVKISEMLSSSQRILETAKKLKKSSNGKAKLFPGLYDMFDLYMGSIKKPWVKDDKLAIKDNANEILNFIDLAKKFKDENLYFKDEKNLFGYNQWSTEWVSSINAEESAMCYAVVPWGIKYIIEEFDKKNRDKGKWGIAKPPYPYFKWGTWIGINAKSKNKEIAMEFVRFLTLNKSHLMEWSNLGSVFVNDLQLIRDNAITMLISTKQSTRTFTRFLGIFILELTEKKQRGMTITLSLTIWRL